jgi:hypothetical protein
MDSPVGRLLSLPSDLSHGLLPSDRQPVESRESTRAYRARSANFGQPFRSLSDHVYPSLQFLLQVGDVHLVRDAIGVADAFHVAVLHHFLQTPQHGHARQLEGVGDLACANGRTHDGAQEDIDADGSVGQAVAMSRKFRAIVIGS